MGIQVRCPATTRMVTGNIWKSDLGLLLPSFECPFQLHGKVVNASFTGMPPYIVSQGNQLHGCDVDVLNTLAGHFNFRVDFFRHNTWVSVTNVSGQFEGVIGDVRN